MYAFKIVTTTLDIIMMCIVFFLFEVVHAKEIKRLSLDFMQCRFCI